MIFDGSLAIASKSQGKKLEHGVTLSQHLNPRRRMKWSEMDIMFSPSDNPKIEMFDRNLSFMVKILICQHKVAKTLIDNGSALNLIMTYTIIEMGLNLIDLEIVKDTFHGVILRLSSTPLGRLDLPMVCRLGDNKRHETLTFEVANFDMGYNCILGRPFLIKFMTVIHTAYVVMKLSA
jgi:hypothetical protein